MKPVLRLLLATLLGCALVQHSSAQVVNRPPVPEWITDTRAQPNQPVFFRREFTAPSPLLKSVLLGACEGRMEAFLNGARVGEISGATNPTGFDVTGQLKPGNNILSLRAVNPGGPAKVAVLLELNADLARQQWVISDTNWSASVTETALAPARSLGRVDTDAKANPFAPDKMVDAYNSWTLARAGTAATDPATYTLLPGFKAELVRSALPEEGSWIALAFDPQGRLTLAREKKGLLRLSLDSAGVSKVEVINDTLLECRGLLYAHGALYANANNSKTLVRLRDTKGTGQFDELTELLKTDGGVGHGRNHLKLGPDGWLWIAHGNNVHLPKNLSTNSPLKNFAHDRLIPCPWDAGMFDGDVVLPAGHILRMKPDGSEVQLWAGGLRNPLDIAFNEHGDLFTFDADMEWDVGCPWYMPNRVLHVVPGADFGWRRGTGRWPAWYPDTLPSVVDIGLASPTGVIFGHGAKFPAQYQRALFLCDWAYGRILAVHMTPQGASYTGTSELFVGGRPMNVTDACIGPDGAMWFTTGGRGTQSGLYRVTAIGQEQLAAAKEPMPDAIKRRQALEQMPTISWAEHDKDEAHPKKLVQTLVTALQENSPWMSHAVQFLHQRQLERFHTEAPPEDRFRAVPRGLVFDVSKSDLSAKQFNVSTPPWFAHLKHTSQSYVVGERSQHALRIMLEFGLTKTNAVYPTFTEEQLITTLRLLSLSGIRFGTPTEAHRQASLNWLEPLYPNPSPRVNQMLVELLVYLRSPQVVAKTVPLLRAATASEDLLLYPFYLRYARDGWTPDARRAVFDALDRAERLPGGRTYFTSIANVRKELLASLTPEERTALGRSVGNQTASAAKADLPAVAPPRFVKDWKLADLEPRLAEVGNGRSHAGARTALVAAQCVHCHRVSNDPAFPNSVIGPELLAVGARFSRRDLLFHILEPSAVIDEKFRQPRLLLTDGDVVSGAIEREEGGKLFVRPNPLEEKLVEVPLTSIRERRVSDVSPMPSGLLNGLRLEQILDLLAYLEAAGDPKHRNFQP
ncbi:MAG: hypothetical protein ACKODH_02965 [Limisphaerales bacterium]